MLSTDKSTLEIISLAKEFVSNNRDDIGENNFPTLFAYLGSPFTVPCFAYELRLTARRLSKQGVSMRPFSEMLDALVLWEKAVSIASEDGLEDMADRNLQWASARARSAVNSSKKRGAYAHV